MSYVNRGAALSVSSVVEADLKSSFPHRKWRFPLRSCRPTANLEWPL